MSKKLSCEDVIARLFEYLDRETNESVRADIDHHLIHCRECYSRAEFEKRLRKRVADTGSSDASEALRRRIKSLIDEF